MALSRAATLGMMGLVATLLYSAALPNVDGLSYDYYAVSCPNLELMVRTAVEAALEKDIGNAAGLLRFYFHDCFPQGCDASILFYNAESTIELDMPPNRGLRESVGQLIDDIHRTVNAACGPVVSCTDMLALATRAAVMNLSVPGYEVPLGRLDSLQPAPLSTVLELPGPDLNATQLIESFRSRNLNEDDLVALSGAHTIGRARCDSFRNRVGEDAQFVDALREKCAQNPNSWRQDLDVTTPYEFDNKYFANLQEGKGVLNSDMALTGHASTSGRVDDFAQDQGWFFAQFSNSMSKLAHLHGDQGKEGEIRKYSCNFSNKWWEDVKLAGKGLAASA